MFVNMSIGEGGKCSPVCWLDGLLAGFDLNLRGLFSCGVMCSAECISVYFIQQPHYQMSYIALPFKYD